MIGNKYIKKFLSVLSAAAVLLSVAVMPASAESSGDFYEIVKGRNLDFTGNGSVGVDDLGIYHLYYDYLDNNRSYADVFDKLLANGDFDNNGEIDRWDLAVMTIVVSGKLTDYLPGDVNLDGVINGSDATLALNCYTQLSAGVSQNKIPYYYLIKGYGDMNGDEIITASDATVILNMYTEFSARK